MGQMAPLAKSSASIGQLNAAFYCFAALSELPALRKSWLARLSELGVKGTIILAPEGVNGFLAGAEEKTREAISLVRSYPALRDLKVKESFSLTMPFAK